MTSDYDKTITTDFTKEELYVLFAINDYMYCSNIDLNSIEDAAERDKYELQLRRSVDALNAISEDMEKAYLAKLSILHEKMVEAFKEVPTTEPVTEPVAT